MAIAFFLHDFAVCKYNAAHPIFNDVKLVLWYRPLLSHLLQYLS